MTSPSPYRFPSADEIHEMTKAARQQRNAAVAAALLGGCRAVVRLVARMYARPFARPIPGVVRGAN